MGFLRFGFPGEAGSARGQSELADVELFADESPEPLLADEPLELETLELEESLEVEESLEPEELDEPRLSFL